MSSSKMPGSMDGASSAYTLAGPPDRMMAAGASSRTSSAVMSHGTISEYTRKSRTRRAISCPYWAPKSTTMTNWLDGVAVMFAPLRTGGGMLEAPVEIISLPSYMKTKPARRLSAHLHVFCMTGRDGGIGRAVPRFVRSLRRAKQLMAQCSHLEDGCIGAQLFFLEAPLL